MNIIANINLNDIIIMQLNIKSNYVDAVECLKWF